MSVSPVFLHSSSKRVANNWITKWCMLIIQHFCQSCKQSTIFYYPETIETIFPEGKKLFLSGSMVEIRPRTLFGFGF